jgi:hypothetical protein
MVKASLLSFMPALLILASAASVLADSRSQKYRSNGCEVERKFDDDGKSETKVDCKPGYGRAYAGAGKEEFRQGGCEIKREWKPNGEYKEEVKCK